MKKRNAKKIISFVLSLCMTLTMIMSVGSSAAKAAEPSTMYFWNSQGWSEVGAYVYGNKGELLGGWPGVDTVTADEIGEGWVKVDLTDSPSFNIIFFNKENEAERAELLIPDASHQYVAVDGKAYTSKEDAEAALVQTPTTIYFMNNNGWENVYAYAYADDADVDTAWPGTAAESAEKEMGEGWWKVSIPRNGLLNPFTVIFSNNGESRITDINITNYKNNYATGNGECFVLKQEAEASVGVSNDTMVYFLNSKDWANVGAYSYGVGEPLGPWPGQLPEEAPELGEKWMKISISAKPPFSVIFFNKESEQERAELQLPNEKTVYVTGSNEVYSSVEAAELAEGLGNPDKMTKVYFYNSRGWGDINAYVYVEDGDSASTLGAGWPGKAATQESELGENWWSIEVPREASAETPFKIIFNDGVNQTADIPISDKDNVYTTAAGTAHAGTADAEAAAANDGYDDGCEDGPNADLDSYNVKYHGAGANLPYVTYEAEAAGTNGEVLKKDTAYVEAIQSEASGRQAVKLVEEGDYVEFKLTEDANALVLRYSIPDSEDGAGLQTTLSMYADGTEVQDLALTSEYAWVYGTYPYTNNPSEGKPHRFYDETRLLLGETLQKGTVIKLQKDAGDDAENYIIDFIECELVEAPLTQPDGSLSVTDYGAVADDGQDDRAAFEACIEAAQNEDKEVWIPAGTFDLAEEVCFNVNGVTIRGAGMWYTNLKGAGAAFKYQGTSKFYDFAMTGVSKVRDDGGDLAGFEGNGSRATNVTIQNIWMEHMKVGIWSCNTENLVVQGCRIRNTYADGMNLCSGTHNAMVRNNSVRNTGDDCIAIWPWLANCTNNTIAHNTVQAPMLANGVAIYGGGGHVVDSNHVSDIINNGSGICVGSEFDTKEGYTDTITVKNNLLDRCGSMQTDENYPIGAIWLWSSWNPMTSAYEIYDNELNDCSYEGVLIECDSQLTSVSIKDIDINGATDAIFVRGNGPGEAVVSNIDAENITGEMIHSTNPKVVISEQNDAGNGGMLAAIVGVALLGGGGAVIISRRKKGKKG